MPGEGGREVSGGGVPISQAVSSSSSLLPPGGALDLSPSILKTGEAQHLSPHPGHKAGGDDYFTSEMF